MTRSGSHHRAVTSGIPVPSENNNMRVSWHRTASNQHVSVYTTVQSRYDMMTSLSELCIVCATIQLACLRTKAWQYDWKYIIGVAGMEPAP